jgi:phenylalanyl-tRNA synthetase alpha chain
MRGEPLAPRRARAAGTPPDWLASRTVKVRAAGQRRFRAYNSSVDFDVIERTATAELKEAADSAALERWRVAHLGRSAPLMVALSGLSEVPKEQRRDVGRRGNELKRALEAAYASRAELLQRSELERAIEAGAVDVTLPGRPRARGQLHPLTLTMRRIYRIFGDMGFQIYRSREVETDEYNFGLLNIPPHHPARDMFDTFYTTSPNVILRTHTSPGQIHAMRRLSPQPLRVILPGLCYRYEEVTARSDVQFYQVEGLAVGSDVTLANLKATLTEFAHRLFGASVRTRFRADYFPFTEPSAEMDVECFVCAGRGCPVCKYTRWLEILGCGMVHPQVLVNGGYDPARVSGFAFGMGPARIAMLLHRIQDIRYFFTNDLRFLEQF